MKPITLEANSRSSMSESSSLPRCSYHSPTGRHCAELVPYPSARLCLRHTRSKSYRPDPALSAELLGSLTEFQSAADVLDFLSRLLILLAQDRITPRRAAVMIYACNQILRSLRAITLESVADADAFPQHFLDLVQQKGDIAAAAAAAAASRQPLSAERTQPQ